MIIIRTKSIKTNIVKRLDTRADDDAVVAQISFVWGAGAKVPLPLQDTMAPS